MNFKKKILSVVICAGLTMTCFTGCEEKKYFDIEVDSIGDLLFDPGTTVKNVKKITGKAELNKVDDGKTLYTMSGWVKFDDEYIDARGMLRIVFDEKKKFSNWEIAFIDPAIDDYQYDINEDPLGHDNGYFNLSGDTAPDILGNMSDEINQVVGEPFDYLDQFNSGKIIRLSNKWDCGNEMNLRLCIVGNTSHPHEDELCSLHYENE